MDTKHTACRGLSSLTGPPGARLQGQEGRGFWPYVLSEQKTNERTRRRNSGHRTGANCMPCQHVHGYTPGAAGMTTASLNIAEESAYPTFGSVQDGKYVL